MKNCNCKKKIILVKGEAFIAKETFCLKHGYWNDCWKCHPHEFGTELCKSHFIEENEEEIYCILCGERPEFKKIKCKDTTVIKCNDCNKEITICKKKKSKLKYSRVLNTHYGSNGTAW